MIDAGALTPLTFAFALFVMALAGFVHGALGLGFPLVATPLLALVTDVKTAIVFTLLPTLASTIISVVRGGGSRRRFCANTGRCRSTRSPAAISAPDC